MRNEEERSNKKGYRREKGGKIGEKAQKRNTDDPPGLNDRLRDRSNRSVSRQKSRERLEKRERQTSGILDPETSKTTRGLSVAEDRHLPQITNFRLEDQIVQIVRKPLIDTRVSLMTDCCLIIGKKKERQRESGWQQYFLATIACSLSVATIMILLCHYNIVDSNMRGTIIRLLYSSRAATAINQCNNLIVMDG